MTADDYGVFSGILFLVWVVGFSAGLGLQNLRKLFDQL